MKYFDVLIIGAGHAGCQVAITLRQLKYQGSVAVLSDEQDEPYERPPLSKEYLQGQKSFEHMLIRPASFWNDQSVAMLLGTRVVQILASERVAISEKGERYGFGKLIWATGGSPRRLTCEGAGLRGVHYIRTRADVDGLLDGLPRSSSVVVVGGGYIGLEAAASLRKLNKEVVLLESADRVLGRVAGEELSRFIEDEHRRHGVEVRLSTQVESLVGSDDCVSSVQLKNGSRIHADLVIVGIGITPSVKPMLEAGAEEGCLGIAVDAHCRTSLSDVYAIGDCASFANYYTSNKSVRLESVQNAVDQANVVAKSIVGMPVAYESLPWFWSNQYDLRLQTAGLSSGYDHVEVRGDRNSRSFSIEYFHAGQLIAVDCVNAPRDYVAARKKLTLPLTITTQ